VANWRRRSSGAPLQGSGGAGLRREHHSARERASGEGYGVSVAPAVNEPATDAPAAAEPEAAGTHVVAPVTRWLGAPWADQALVWAWVPFALLGAFLADRVAAAVAVTYAFSYSHQLLTIPLVYGDGATFRSRRLVFTLAPVVVVVAVAVLWTEAFVALAIIGASWNVFHTLQQRYGLVRLYGRRVGQDRPGVERWLIFAGFATALTAAVASPRLGDQFSSGVLDLGEPGMNTWTAGLLADARPVGALLAPVMLVLTIALGRRWWQQERVRPQNRAKHWYLGSTMVMFAVAPFAPMAALLGFIGSHAAEYYVVVARSLRSRTAATPRSLLARVTAVLRPWPAVVLFGVGAVWLVYWSMTTSIGVAAFVVALSLSALHFLYDGIIWRVGRPAYRVTFRGLSGS